MTAPLLNDSIAREQTRQMLEGALRENTLLREYGARYFGVAGYLLVLVHWKMLGDTQDTHESPRLYEFTWDFSPTAFPHQPRHRVRTYHYYNNAQFYPTRSLQSDYERILTEMICM